MFGQKNLLLKIILLVVKCLKHDFFSKIFCTIFLVTPKQLARTTKNDQEPPRTTKNDQEPPRTTKRRKRKEMAFKKIDFGEKRKARVSVQVGDGGPAVTYSVEVAGTGGWAVVFKLDEVGGKGETMALKVRTKKRKNMKTNEALQREVNMTESFEEKDGIVKAQMATVSFGDLRGDAILMPWVTCELFTVFEEESVRAYDACQLFEGMHPHLTLFKNMFNDIFQTPGCIRVISVHNIRQVHTAALEMLKILKSCENIIVNVWDPEFIGEMTRAVMDMCTQIRGYMWQWGSHVNKMTDINKYQACMQSMQLVLNGSTPMTQELFLQMDEVRKRFLLEPHSDAGLWTCLVKWFNGKSTTDGVMGELLWTHRVWEANMLATVNLPPYKMHLAKSLDKIMLTISMPPTRNLSTQFLKDLSLQLAHIGMNALGRGRVLRDMKLENTGLRKDPITGRYTAQSFDNDLTHRNDQIHSCTGTNFPPEDFVDFTGNIGTHGGHGIPTQVQVGDHVEFRHEVCCRSRWVKAVVVGVDMEKSDVFTLRYIDTDTFITTSLGEGRTATDGYSHWRNEKGLMYIVGVCVAELWKVNLSQQQKNAQKRFVEASTARDRWLTECATFQNTPRRVPADVVAFVGALLHRDPTQRMFYPDSLVPRLGGGEVTTSSELGTVDDSRCLWNVVRTHPGSPGSSLEQKDPVQETEDSLRKGLATTTVN